MKRILFFALFLTMSLANIDVNAQSEPVLYFCERYETGESGAGEVNVSDRFYPGYLTVVVKSSYALGLNDCYIQFDKYNTSSKKFDFYKRFDFTVKSEQKYVFFERTEGNDMSFDDPGFYRVYLLDASKQNVTSSLIEIIPRR